MKHELKEAYCRKLPHIEPGERAVFVTFCTRNRFILPEHTRGLVIERCLRGHDKMYHLHGVIVMPDHVHLAMTPLAADDGSPYAMAAIMKTIKGGSARAVNLVLGRRGALWQAESFDRILRSEENARAKMEYICLNPVRARLIGDGEEYPWLWREWIEGRAG